MNTNSSENNAAALDEKKHQRPQPEDVVKCPRCDSENTKFCYYNNYSLSQPRYFCKACRRYWTKGGTLRNVPVGGGCRKKKRSAERHHHQLMVQNQVENAMSSASARSKLPLSSFSSPLRFEDASGTGDILSLAFARLQKQRNNGHLGFDQFDHHQPAHPVFGNPVTNLGLFSNLYETQTASFDAQSMYTYGFGNGGSAQDHHQSHNQPLLPSEDLSLSNLSAAPAAEVFSLMSGTVKQEMCGNVGMNDNRMLFGFPWQMTNNGAPSSSTENLLLGSSNSNSYNYNNGRESWNSTGLAAAQSWPNIINSTALM